MQESVREKLWSPKLYLTTQNRLTAESEKITIDPAVLKATLATPEGKKKAIGKFLEGGNLIHSWKLERRAANFRPGAITKKKMEEGQCRRQANTKSDLLAREIEDMRTSSSAWGGSQAAQYVNPNKMRMY